MYHFLFCFIRAVRECSLCREHPKKKRKFERPKRSTHGQRGSYGGRGRGRTCTTRLCSPCGVPHSARPYCAGLSRPSALRMIKGEHKSVHHSAGCSKSGATALKISIQERGGLGGPGRVVLIHPVCFPQITDRIDRHTEIGRNCIIGINGMDHAFCFLYIPGFCANGYRLRFSFSSAVLGALLSGRAASQAILDLPVGTAAGLNLPIDAAGTAFFGH